MFIRKLNVSFLTTAVVLPQKEFHKLISGSKMVSAVVSLVRCLFVALLGIYICMRLGEGVVCITSELLSSLHHGDSI